MRRISVLVVDDHPVFADAMQARLSAEPDLDPVIVAYSPSEAVRRIAAERPALVVLDYRLGEGSGLDVADAASAASPSTRIIMLSGTDAVEPVVQAVRLGVRGWLPKTVDVEDVIAAVRAVAAGDAWFPPRLLGRVLDRLYGPAAAPADPLAVLTEREREVLGCFARGLSRSETAQELRITLNTVRTHTQSVMAKLGVHSALEAVAVHNRATSP